MLRTTVACKTRNAKLVCEILVQRREHETGQRPRGLGKPHGSAVLCCEPLWQVDEPTTFSKLQARRAYGAAHLDRSTWHFDRTPSCRSSRAWHRESARRRFFPLCVVTALHSASTMCLHSEDMEERSRRLPIVCVR